MVNYLIKNFEINSIEFPMPKEIEYSDEIPLAVW